MENIYLCITYNHPIKPHLYMLGATNVFLSRWLRVKLHQNEIFGRQRRLKSQFFQSDALLLTIHRLEQTHSFSQQST